MPDKKITFLLCLKDRSIYSRSWIENNIDQEFNYIIADGSENNENFEIFNQLTFDNVIYIRYEYDKDLKTYFNKVLRCDIVINPVLLVFT